MQAAFAKKFSNATARWEKENRTYEANFVLRGVKTSAIYLKTGEFQEVEETMSINALPPPAAAYLAKQYPGQKIAEVGHIKNATGEVTWEAEVGGQDVIFDINGEFVRVEKAANDDKDKPMTSKLD